MELIVAAKEEEEALIYLRVSLSQCKGPATSMDLCVCTEFQFVLCTFNQHDLSKCFSLISFSFFLQKTLICSPSSLIWPPPPLATRELYVLDMKSPGSSPWATAPSWSPFPMAPTRCTTANCPATPTTSWTAFLLRHISKRYRETTSTPPTALSISWVAA